MSEQAVEVVGASEPVWAEVGEGPETDALVATLVMGWERVAGNWKRPLWCDPGYPREGHVYEGFEPSRVHASAWKVLEWLGTEHLVHFVHVSRLHDGDLWIVSLDGKHPGGPINLEGEGPTFELAVCRAALKAVSRKKALEAGAEVANAGG